MAQSQQQRRLHKVETVSEMDWRKNTGPALECLYTLVDSQALRGAVDAVSRAGGAIMFSLTQDGGAFAICILYKDEKLKKYPHGEEEMNATLAGITRAFSEEIA